jgi:hypothetical protein
MDGTKRRIKSTDEPLIARALAFAIEAIDRLPPNWQGSDKSAMIALLHHVAPHGDAERLRLLARARLEQRGVDVVSNRGGTAEKLFRNKYLTI